jgi:hypothetical protein
MIPDVVSGQIVSRQISGAIDPDWNFTPGPRVERPFSQCCLLSFPGRPRTNRIRSSTAS